MKLPAIGQTDETTLKRASEAKMTEFERSIFDYLEFANLCSFQKCETINN
jgi:hypothetical protein